MPRVVSEARCLGGRQLLRGGGVGEEGGGEWRIVCCDFGREVYVFGARARFPCVLLFCGAREWADKVEECGIIDEMRGSVGYVKFLSVVEAEDGGLVDVRYGV